MLEKQVRGFRYARKPLVPGMNPIAVAKAAVVTLNRFMFCFCKLCFLLETRRFLRCTDSSKSSRGSRCGYVGLWSTIPPLRRPRLTHSLLRHCAAFDDARVLYFRVVRTRSKHVELSKGALCLSSVGRRDPKKFIRHHTTNHYSNKNIKTTPSH